jgi:hypothetical protein
MFTGRCLCGQVQFRIDSQLAPIQICHCQQCRRAQGTPFATNIPVSSRAFKIVHGADLLASYESSPGKKRTFCSKCGSPVYSSRDSSPELLRVRAGLIEEPLPVRPIAHIFAGAACNWWPITDSLPQFPGTIAPGAPKTADG